MLKLSRMIQAIRLLAWMADLTRQIKKESTDLESILPAFGIPNQFQV